MPKKQPPRSDATGADDASKRVKTEASEIPQCELRHIRYLNAVQSERVTVIVGEEVNQKSYDLAHQLLTQCSEFFSIICEGPFQESQSGNRVIKLPDDSTAVFEVFIKWIYMFEPRLPPYKDGGSLILLALFADKYQIRHLMNQICDEVRTEMVEKRWVFTPETMKKLFGRGVGVDALQDLCALGFTNRQHEGDMQMWKSVFEACPSLGYRCFCYSQQREGPGNYSNTMHKSLNGCLWHDHSDIAEGVSRRKSGYSRPAEGVCPYPHGAPIVSPSQ
ncbi:MAG: hypothetical protein M1819_005455 [Sarea resinae]|nr:MAG: hypothetical protein M1819_005455 [Sarea resinae]